MKSIYIKMFYRGFFLIALCSIFSFASIGYAAEVGVTDKEILVGTVADTTGPLALNGVQLNLGARTYFSKINDQGGVYGRKLNLIAETDDYQTGKHIAALRKLIFVDKVFGFINNVGSSSTIAAMPILQQEKIPLLGPQAPQPQLYYPAKRYIFGFYPDYVINGRLLLEYTVKVAGKKGLKIAVFYQDDDVGKSALKGIEERMAKHPQLEMKIVSTAGYKRGETDLSSQAIKIKQAEPDVVLIVAIQGPMAGFLKEAQKLNWKPRFISSMAAEPTQTVELAGAAAEGVSFLHTFYTHKMTEVQSVKEFTEMLAKYSPNEKPHTYSLCGYSVAKLFVEGLSRAGKDLTREKFVDALDNIKNFDTGCGILVSFTPENHTGCVERAFFSQVKKGEIVREADWVYAQ